MTDDRSSRRLRAAAFVAKLALGLVMTAWMLLVVAWGALQFWIVPRADAWRPALEAVATRALGVRVVLGAIEATADAAAPVITLRDVRLYDASGREALHLPRVRAALSLASLWRLGFDQLVIDEPTLEVRRLADGRLQVAGLDVGVADGDSALADWFFGQREFALRAGTLRWIDEQSPDAPPLVLTAVDLVLRNPGLRHEFRLDATPPPDWGERFSLRGRFAHAFWQIHPGRWRAWSGELFLQAPQLDVQRLALYTDLAPWGVRELRARGALRMWAEVASAQWRAFTADVQWHDLFLAWAPGKNTPAQPLAVAHLGGRVELQRNGNTTILRTQGLTLTSADGSAWPHGDIRFEYVVAPDGALRSWALSSDRLDLGVVQRLARVLPLGEAVNQWAASLQPSGIVQDLRLRWSAAAKAGAPERWRASGRVRGLVVRPGPVPPAAADATRFGRPGIEQADAVFDLDERGGRATVALRAGALTFPGLFEQPRLAFDELSADLRWTIDGEAIALDISRLTFANADVAGQGSLRWRTADPARSAARDRFPGVMRLDIQLTRANGARVARYLPVTIGADVRRYLHTAVRAGRVDSATFRVDGDLRDFPFAHARQGIFEVRAQLHDVTLDYAPQQWLPAGSAPWPALERVTAELLIERQRLQIDRASGRVLGQPGLQALQVQALIPDYLADEPQLQLNGLIRGAGDDALRFVAASPVRAWTAGVLDTVRVSGALDVALQLQMPLSQTERTQVRGQVRFAGNDVQLRPDVPTLQAVHATLDFSEQGFTLGAASARVLGGELRFSGAMTRRGGASLVRFQGQGSASATGLAASQEWAWARWLGRHAQGTVRYTLGLTFGPDGMDLQLESDLRGLALSLPAPLTKPADAVWQMALAVNTRARAEPTPERTRDRLRLTLAPSAGGVPLQAEFEREHVGPHTEVQRGRLAVGADLPDWPPSGVAAMVRLQELDADAWMAILDKGRDTAVGARAGSAAALEWQSSGAYWPSQLGISLERLVLGGRTFDAVTAGGMREGDAWRLSVVARQLEGHLEYRAAPEQKLVARLSRLALPPGAAADVERIASQPNAVPALDVVVDAFELAGRSLGRLEVQAVNREAQQGGDIVREWRLQSLRISLPEARLSASGNWAPVAAFTSPGQAASARSTAMQVRLDIDDAGALLDRFGFVGVVRGGRGRLEGTLGWLGSPLALHIPSLSGELLLDVQRGQFLKADPGIAKLLGVLSLQSLPRRLTLDFRDLFSEGFAFDFVRGNARLVQGVASTNNLQMKGVSAAVLIEGQADLVRETQDLTVVVVPELNAGTASLVATMINPVTGLGSFLAQWLLREPLQAATTQTFHISGSWADPQVERIARTVPQASTPEANPAPKP